MNNCSLTKEQRLTNIIGNYCKSYEINDSISLLEKSNKTCDDDDNNNYENCAIFDNFIYLLSF